MFSVKFDKLSLVPVRVCNLWSQMKPGDVLTTSEAMRFLSRQFRYWSQFGIDFCIADFAITR
ncbi:MAG: hypothetical protein IPP40_08060 [bacterium]|nr:hypothetical protein [bacterium]